MAKLLEAQIHEEPSFGAPYPFAKVVQSMQGKNNGERKNRVKKTEDSSCSLLSHFWSTFRSPFSTFYIPFQILGSQESNASNGAQFGVETKKLQPLQASHSKVLRNQPFVARISQHFCTVRCFSFWRCTNHAARRELVTSRWKPTSQPCEDSSVLRNNFVALLGVCEISQTPFSPAKWFLKAPDICAPTLLDIFLQIFL